MTPRPCPRCLRLLISPPGRDLRQSRPPLPERPSTRAALPSLCPLKSLFAAEGIPPSRWCLKIPSTGAGLVAAKQLESEGIRTLATTLFSVDQALAASQAGCLYIAPYWNELSVHFEPETWREYETPEKEHPMSEVICKIVDVYKGIEPRPLIMPAR
jgi:transaldolase